MARPRYRHAVLSPTRSPASLLEHGLKSTPRMDGPREIVMPFCRFEGTVPQYSRRHSDVIRIVDRYRC